MIRFFRSGNPLTVLLLLIYTLVVKFFYLLHPSTYLADGSEGFLYELLVKWMQQVVGNSPYFFTCLTILILLVQALLFTKIINHHRLFTKPTYLPAMTYMLFTSLLNSWTVFSPVLLVNLIMLWVFSSLTDLYSRASVRDVVFNTGFAIGIASLIYFPSVIFLLLLLISLLIMRAFRLAEWILGLLGLICPIYLLGTYLFLTDRLPLLFRIPNIGISNPFVNDYKVWGAAVVCLLFFVLGWLLLQGALKKMLIQGRKIWSMSLVFVAVALLVPFFGLHFSPAYWLLAVLPISMFGGNVFWSIRNDTIANAVHFLVLAYVLVMQFFS
ncbi:hypothetical protein GA0116948_103208 [Chitinophaga costaii]|uniref:Beta-carotene 15,15'-monooxygenase n=1 Tax=Chitinophaga costaii TaxID=1335309 RepID=A0A1C4BQ76_9BACT|nr:hypothetical protein [Chitinophaga costaii]PUZ27517.1 hypothetical protein DCM91_04625 [Chitinophaga costaii]SCC09035.1 hypothetical protein GA0116948_103208 [Chitinophaga costaii]